ncbi:FecCD family ABC transporter permease [Nocardia grenadensis]
MLASLAAGIEAFPVTSVLEAVAARVTGRVAADPTIDIIVWELRTPRAILAAVVGAGLSLAGLAMQTLVRNPLADPYLLGVSSGAGVGATAVITLGVLGGWGIWALSGGALAGALVAAATVYLVAAAQGGLTPLRLVLTGVVLGSAFSSLASFLVFAAEDGRAAQSVLFWLLGTLSGAAWVKIWLPLTVVVAALALLIVFGGWLDALAAGPDTAASLGVPVTALRRGLFAGLALVVGVLVAVSGGIGFVGLVIPHLARRLVGARHRTLVPVAALTGAVFLVCVDIATRMLFRPLEIPIGVVTGLVGAPVFLLLMNRAEYRFGGSR